jgi:hypothetical protein
MFSFSFEPPAFPRALGNFPAGEEIVSLSDSSPEIAIDGNYSAADEVDARPVRSMRVTSQSDPLVPISTAHPEIVVRVA